MADEGHVLTDELLKKLEKDVAREYRIAVKDMQAKLTAYLEKTEAQRQVQEGLLNAGKITDKEYRDWCYRHNMVGKRWKEMCETLAEDMHHANEIALGMTKDKMPDVYALNANYGTYQIETGGGIDTGFTLYNHDTAEYLLGDQRQLMPKPSARKAAQIAANKDMQWNMQKIQSAVLQGVLQGESPYKVAERLRGVGQMNYNASIRYARTMATSAQNAGRYEAYRRADKLGVDLTIEWQATLDSRTRHDHRMMHGQRTDVDKPFHTPDGFTIYYPADCTGSSTAPQREIWNCRCTLLAWVKGFEGNTVKESPKMDGMSFEEWQNDKTASMKGSGELESLMNAPTINHSAKEVKELETYAEEKGLRLVNANKFDGDSDILKGQIDVIAGYQEEFNIRRKLKVEICETLPDNAIGGVNHSGDVIQLFSPALRDRSVTNRYLNADRELSSTDVSGIAAHEMGHVISRAKGEKGLYIAKKAYYNLTGEEISDRDALRYLDENVSLYSSEKKDTRIGKNRRTIFEEIMPEVLALDTTSPNEFSREFVRIAREMLGK